MISVSLWKKLKDHHKHNRSFYSSQVWVILDYHGLRFLSTKTKQNSFQVKLNIQGSIEKIHFKRDIFNMQYWMFPARWLSINTIYHQFFYCMLTKVDKHNKHMKSASILPSPKIYRLIATLAAISACSNTLSPFKSYQFMFTTTIKRGLIIKMLLKTRLIAMFNI